jgi:hypothetical protein
MCLILAILFSRRFLSRRGAKSSIQVLTQRSVDQQLVTHVDFSTAAAGDHRYCKGRVLMAELLGQRGENRQIAVACSRIGVGGDAPGFRLGDVELHSTDADFPTYPALLFPGG